MSPVHLLSGADIKAVALVGKGANRKQFFLRKEDGAELAQLNGGGRIVKADDWSTVYCVVAEPDWHENAGQIGDSLIDDRWASADEIQKAAWGFMANGALINKMHSSMEPYGTVVENFIAPADFNVDGEQIRKGSWVIAIQPNDEGRAAIEAGEFTGVSIEGIANRELVKAWDESLHPRDKGRFTTAHSNREAARQSRNTPSKFAKENVKGYYCSQCNASMPHDLPPVGARCPGCGSRLVNHPEHRAKMPPISKRVSRGETPELVHLPAGTDIIKDALLVPNIPGKTNWVQESGGLPHYIADIAGDLITERGMTTSHAIEVAVGVVRNWCHGHGGNVTAKTRAKACAAAAEWEAKKAAAHVRKDHFSVSAIADAKLIAEGSTAQPSRIEAVDDATQTWIEKIGEKLGISKDDVQPPEPAPAGNDLADALDQLEEDLGKALEAKDADAAHKAVHTFAAFVNSQLPNAEPAGPPAHSAVPPQFQKAEGSSEEVDTVDDMNEAELAKLIDERLDSKLEKALEAMPEKVAKAIEAKDEAEEKPDPEALAKEIADIRKDLDEKVEKLEGSVQKLGEGDTSQGSDTETEAEGDKVKKAYDARELDASLAGIL